MSTSPSSSSLPFLGNGGSHPLCPSFLSLWPPVLSSALPPLFLTSSSPAGSSHSPSSPTPSSPPSSAPPSSSTPPSPPSPPSPSRQSSMFVAGLVSGVIVAGLFNPWDRALYLSVLHERPFLHRENFVQPYKGFYQALFFRTLSSGLYFPLFDLFQPLYQRLIASSSSPSPTSHPLLVHFLAGNTAGAVSGVVLNQFTAIKYASWDAERGGFFATARSMWREGGVQPFMKGIVPTVCRDTIFGGVFALSKEGCARLLNRIRQRGKPSKEQRRRGSSSSSPPSGAAVDGSSSHEAVATTFARSFSRWSDSHGGTIDFVSSLIAGALGTVASSPFNFVRNMKYGWPASSTPPSAVVILRDLAAEAATKRREDGWRPSLVFVQDRLRIGWGTARVAVGMAIGYEIYEVTKAALEKANTQQPPLGRKAGATEAAAASPVTPSPLPFPTLPSPHAGGHALVELPDSASPRPTARKRKGRGEEDDSGGEEERW